MASAGVHAPAEAAPGRGCVAADTAREHLVYPLPRSTQRIAVSSRLGLFAPHVSHRSSAHLRSRRHPPVSRTIQASVDLAVAWYSRLTGTSEPNVRERWVPRGRPSMGCLSPPRGVECRKGCQSFLPDALPRRDSVQPEPAQASPSPAWRPINEPGQGAWLRTRRSGPSRKVRQARSEASAEMGSEAPRGQFRLPPARGCTARSATWLRRLRPRPGSCSDPRGRAKICSED